MDRLVIQNKAGSLCYNDTAKGLELEPNEITSHQCRLLLERLHEYEDIGLTPEQIEELKERDTAKVPIYQVQGDERYEQEPEWWMCPCCEEIYDMDDDYDFCPNCGQRLLR